MAITQTISSLGTVPTTDDPANFDANADSFLGTALPNLRTELNTFATQANTLQADVNNKQIAATAAAVIAQAALDAGLENAAENAATAAAAAASAASVVQQDLGTIDRTFLTSAALVAICLYDTRKDSDGGAWRKRCGHTSLENETLSGNWLGSAANEAAARAISGATTGSYYYDTTAALFKMLSAGSGTTTTNRGNARQFPAVAIITAESSRVIIWDATQAGCPMWKVFNTTAGYSLHSGTVNRVTALNADIVVSMSTQMIRINLVADSAYKRNATDLTINTNSLGSANSVGTWGSAQTSGAIVNANIRNAAITVLRDAPRDVATGLPVPTIAVATAGGCSVVKHDGTVVSSSHTGSVSRCAWLYGDALVYGQLGGVTFGGRIVEASALSAGFAGTNYDENSTPAVMQMSEVYSAWRSAVFANSGSTLGISLLVPNRQTAASGMVARITKDYNSGWQPGAIKGAWLSDKVVEVKTGGTDTDRSVKANDLTVNGSLTKAAVASGAQLVGYSGFSAANYLSRAYDADFDFGTGDFCIMGWLDQAANSAIETLFERDSASTAQRITITTTAAGYLEFTCDDNTTTRTATGTAAIDDGVPRFVLCTYSAGTLTIYVNGVSYATATGAALLTLNNASAVLRIGCDVAGSYPATNAALALWRTTAYVPTAEQIKHIYETEKALFEAGAQCCIAGTSNAVTALAYDDETDLLHVGTSYGRSAFKGVVRVTSEATPVGSLVALAAGAGIVAQAGASGADVYVPAYNLREELNRKAEQAAAFGAPLVFKDFDATASQTTFALPVGYEPVSVYAAAGAGSATRQREGSGKQWTRAFDGFVWSVVFAAGRSASDWVSVGMRRV